MNGDDLVGCWACELIEQIQSAAAAEQFGEYEEFDHEPQDASETDFDATTLELAADGTYRLQSMDWASSHGSWTFEAGVLALREAVDVRNEFERLAHARCEDGRVVIGFELAEAAHDGRDTLVLSFSRA